MTYSRSCKAESTWSNKKFAIVMVIALSDVRKVDINENISNLLNDYNKLRYVEYDNLLNNLFN